MRQCLHWRCERLWIDDPELGTITAKICRKCGLILVVLAYAP